MEYLEEFTTHIQEKSVLIQLVYPELKLAKKMTIYINKLRDEAPLIGNWRKQTLSEQKKYLKKLKQSMKKKEGLHIVVLTNKKVVGHAVIQKKQYDAQSHVGVFGIGLLKEYTGKGIGKRLGKTMLNQIKKCTTFTLIQSAYNSDNIASKKLHKKLGFKKIGKFPKGIKSKNGKYADEMLVYKKITRN